MNLLAGLVSHLKSTPSITALVGTRIFHRALPPTTTESPTQLPCLIYQLLEEPAPITHDGVTFYQAKVRLRALGGSYSSANGVAEAVHSLLHGYKGLMGDLSIGGVFRERKEDDSEPDVSLEQVIQEFMFNYN